MFGYGIKRVVITWQYNDYTYTLDCGVIVFAIIGDYGSEAAMKEM